jgi:D-alanyl-D-alanine carboxypeptidase
MREAIKSKLLNIGRFILLVLVVLAFFFDYNYKSNFKKEVQRIDEKIAREVFKDVEIMARGAIVLRISDDFVIYEKNQNKPLELASITKLFNDFVFVSNIPLSMDIKIEESDTKMYGASVISPGQTLKALDLLQMSLIVSSNDATTALARSYEEVTERNIVEDMNSFSVKNNFKSIYFNTPTGLPTEDGKAGGVGSARDIAEMLKKISNEYPDVFFLSSYEKIPQSGPDEIVLNTNKALDQIGFKILISKTGYTDSSGGGVAILVEEAGERYAIVLLGSGYTDRFDDLVVLSEGLKEFLNNRNKELSAIIKI